MPKVLVIIMKSHDTDDRFNENITEHLRDDSLKGDLDYYEKVDM